MPETFVLDSGTPIEVARGPGGQVSISKSYGSVIVSGDDLPADVHLGAYWLSPEHRESPLFARLAAGHDAEIVVESRGD